MTSTIELNTQLEALQDDYTFRINVLVEEGREDLVADLSDQYLWDAAALTQRAA